MPNVAATSKIFDYETVAGDAVKYVQAKMTLGATNKIDVVTSQLKSFGGSPLCLLAQRSVTIDSSDGIEPTEQFIRQLAGAAENTGCGNCMEQSAVAFVYLLDRGVRPLDWMALQRPGDHAFVVVGRLAKSAENDPSTWGPLAVVCDPWKEKVYSPNLIVSMWGHRPELLLRIK